VDLGEIRHHIDAEQTRLTAAGALHRTAEDALQAQSDKDAAELRAIELAETIRGADAALETDRSNLPTAIAARDEADHSLRLARASMDLAEQRSTLQEGDPCPLCGSHDHPYRKEKEPGEKLLSALELRFNGLRDSVSSFENRIAASTITCETLAKDLQREQQASAVSAAKLEKLRGEWLQLTATFPVASLPPDPAEKTALRGALQLQESATTALSTVREEERTVDFLLKAVIPARTAMDRARNDRDRILESLQKAEELARETARAESSLAGELEKEQQALIAISALLATPFKDWHGWLPKVTADCAGFIAEVEDAKQLWTVWSDRRTAALAARDDTAGRAKEASARCELLVRAADEKTRSMAEQDLAIKTLLQERSKQFGGAPVDGIERNLSATLSSAREQERVITEEAAKAEKELTSLDGKRDEVEKQLASLRAEQLVALQRLGRECSLSGTAENEIRELLSVGDDWRMASFDRLNKADAKLQEAGTRLDERRESLEQHRKSAVPTIAREALTAKKEEEATLGREFEDRAFAIRHTLKIDAENRKNAENLLPKIEVQRGKTNLWQGMSDLIGSADGKKFRVFAQSLTLDLLLAMANEHMSSLSPRFLLMRVPTSEMELQVIDRDMGDDIRGVNSISGGESFLVSLALALGLSTLASGSTRIGSLFIDEGFGSLDQDTLDTALSTLDALQATGRMVGVISHVSGLTEKIGTRIEVTSTGGGKSCVRVFGV